MVDEQSTIPSVDVIVVTWNQRQLVLDCLSHIAANDVAHRLIVVDNGSTDDTVEAVREAFPSASMLNLGSNIGYGPAFNRGVAAGNGEILVFVNNDANVEPNFLAGVIEPFVEAQIGMVGGVAVNPTNGAIDSAGIQLDRGCGGYLFRAGEPLANLDLDDPTIIAPAFAAVALRREAFEQVGGFDEAIFAYCEEVDLVMRLRCAGWGFEIVETARASHIGSATLGSRTLAQMRHAARSRGYVLGVYRVSPHWLLTEFAVGAVDALRLRSIIPLSARVRGWREGLRVPRRRPPEGIRYVSWLGGMRLRLKAM